jgi:nucleotide-binding universal stress UspA family protein
MASEKIEKKIGVFEQAIHLEKITLGPVPLTRILLAVDAHIPAIASSRSAVQFTAYLASRFSAAVHVLCVATRSDVVELSHSETAKTIELLEARGIAVTGMCIEGQPSDQILRSAESEGSNLIVIPTHYAETVEAPSSESLGTTLDIVVKRAPCPVLIIRQPLSQPEAACEVILFPIYNVAVHRAAEWALTLAETGARLTLLSILDKASLETTKEVVQHLVEDAISDASVERVLGKSIQPLKARLAAELGERGIQVTRTHIVGDRVTAILEERERGRHTLLVLQAEPQKSTLIGATAENLARASDIPVLVVK